MLWVHGTPIHKVQASDVVQLLENEVPESQHLDYKEHFSIDTGDDRKEFLADITSLANTAGGVLIFGVSEQREDGQTTGLPGEITGVGEVNEDDLRLRVEQLVRDGTDPPLSHMEVHFVHTEDGNVIVLGVPASNMAPHAVWYRRSGKFFRRATGGKYQVKTSELEKMFISRTEARRQLPDFRRDRLDKLERKAVNPYTRSDHTTLIHILPLGRLDEFFDVAAEKQTLMPKLRPMMTSSWDAVPVLDGLLAHSTYDPLGCVGYVLWLRNGGVETYSPAFHGLRGLARDVDFIHADWLSAYILKAANKVIPAMDDLWGITYPWAVMVSLLGTRGLTVRSADPRFIPHDVVVHEENLLFPAVILDSEERKAEQLKGLLDLIWQAGGYTKIPDALYTNITAQ